MPDDTPAPRPRWGSRIAALLTVALLATGAWLLGSASGLTQLLKMASSLTGGKLHAEVQDGSLLGGFALTRLCWQSSTASLCATRVRLDWQAWALLRGELVVSGLHADQLDIQHLAQDEADSPPPASLELPLAVDLQALTLNHFNLLDAAGQRSFSADGWHIGRLSSDGRHHQLEDFSTRLSLPDGPALIQGAARLDGRAPFAAEAQLAASTSWQTQPLQADLVANGNLHALELTTSIHYAQQVAQASARIDALSAPYIQRLTLQAEALDPSRIMAGAPRAALSLSAQFAHEATGLRGKLKIDNTASGRLDAGELPVRSISSIMQQDGPSITLTQFEALLSGQGRITGGGRIGPDTTDLQAALTGIDLHALHAAVRTTRLDGQVHIHGAFAQPSVQLTLHQAPLTLQATTTLDGTRISVPQLSLEDGHARLEGSGEYQRPDQHFALKLSLRDFNPHSYLPDLPAARLNAHLESSGSTSPLALRGQFKLDESSLAGQALRGSGEGRLDGERLSDLALDLGLGPNRLQAHGAFGKAGDQLQLQIDAPALALPQLRGDLHAQARLRGSATTPGLDLSLRSRQLDFGSVSLSGLDATLGWPGTAHAPAHLQASLQRLAQAGTVRLSELDATLDGTTERHQLRARAQLPGAAATASLTLDGGLSTGNAPLWRGTLSALHFDSTRFPAWQLDTPAALSLSASTQRLDAMQLRGEDWSIQVAELAHQDGRWSSQGSLTRLPVGRLLQAGDLRLGGHWKLAFDQQASGELDIERDSGDLGIPQENSPPLTLGLETVRLHGRIDHAQASLQAELQGTHLGTLHADAQLPLDVMPTPQTALQADIDLKLARLAWLAPLLDPGTRIDGSLQSRMQVSGTLGQPRLNGHISGDGLTLETLGTGMRLEHGRLEAQLDDSRLSVRTLHFAAPLSSPPEALGKLPSTLAQTLAQAGSIDASGQLDLLQESGSVQLRLEHVGVMQQPRQWAALSGQLGLTLAQHQLHVDGTLGVDAAHWELAEQGRPQLSSDVRIVHADAHNANTRALGLQLSLDVDLGQHVHFAGAGLDTQLAGKLQLQAQGRENLRASGTIRSENGRFNAYGQNLQVQRGLINFQGLLDNPGLNILAVRSGLSVEAGVEVSGTARNPVIRLVSTPDLPDTDKLSWMLLGHGAAQTTGGEQTFLVNAATAILGERSGGGQMVQRIKRGFGLDELGISQGNLSGQSELPTSQVATAQGFSSSSSSTTSGQILSLGKRLSDNLYLSFEQSLNATESIVKLTLQLSRRFALVGRAGSDNAVDATYTLRFGQ